MIPYPQTMNKKRLRVALAQMNSSDSLTENLKTIARLTKAAKKRGASLAAFPENALLIAADGRRNLDIALSDGSPPLQFLADQAKKNQIYLVIGSVPWKTAKSPRPRVYNRTLVFGPTGRLLATYDKLHLFDSVLPDRVYRESALVKCGDRVVLFRTPWGPIGLSICYDLRFPEIYRCLSAKGVRVVLIPSAFTVPTGKVHWDVLTRARAIENQVFVLCPAQTGTHAGGRKTYGHTRVVDPWGELIAEKILGVGLVVADLDFSKQDEIRARLPVHEHRRKSYRIL